MLPQGVHTATIDEVLAAYPPRNQQRQILNDSLQRVIEALRLLDTTIMIYIDGSYVTFKNEPNDVDLLLVTPYHTKRRILIYLDQFCPVEAVSVSVYIAPQVPDVIFRLFTTTRTGKAKGIILLS